MSEVSFSKLRRDCSLARVCCTPVDHSAIQKWKLPIRTPTESFSVFSGTRVSGPRSASAASATATAAPTAPRLAGTIMWPTAPTARTMKTTSRPSRTTALNVVTSATGSHRVAVASAVPASAAVAPRTLGARRGAG